MSRMSEKAMTATSSSTRSAAIRVRADRSATARSMAARMSGFVRFSCPIARAVFGLYPARTAALVAHRSTRYSSTNRCCFRVSVSMAMWGRSVARVRAGGQHVHLLLGDVHLEGRHRQLADRGQRLDRGQVVLLRPLDVPLVVLPQVEVDAVLAVVDGLQVVQVQPARNDALRQQPLQRGRG